jgi:hypothetical protein
LASSGEAAGFLLITERMRLFLSPHTQLSVIPLDAPHALHVGYIRRLRLAFLLGIALSGILSAKHCQR